MKVRHKFLIITAGMILLPMAVSTVVISIVVYRQHSAEAWTRIDEAVGFVRNDIEIRAHKLGLSLEAFAQAREVQDDLALILNATRDPSRLVRAGTRLTEEMRKFAFAAEIDRIALHYPDGRLMADFYFEDGDQRFEFYAADGAGKAVRLTKGCPPRADCLPVDWRKGAPEEWPRVQEPAPAGKYRVKRTGNLLGLEVTGAARVREPGGGPGKAGILIQKHFNLDYVLGLSESTEIDITFSTAMQARLFPLWNAPEITPEFLDGLPADTVTHKELALETVYYGGFFPFRDAEGRLLGVVSARLSQAGTLARTREAIFYLAGIALAAVVLMIPLVLYFSQRFLEPIQALIRGTQAFGAGDLEHRVEEGPDEIGDLAAAFNRMAAGIQEGRRKLEELNAALEEHNRNLEVKIRQATSAIQDLMDNTGQGFLAFGDDFKVHRFYSLPCQTIFGGKIEDLDALDLMFGKPSLSADQVRSASSGGGGADFQPADFEKELIGLVFKGETDLDFLKDLLPQEFHKQGRIISVEFRFIPGSHGREDKIMGVLTDVTRERELSARVESEEERHAILIKVALHRASFIQFLHELDDQFSSVYLELAQPAESVRMDELMRLLHTVKGETASWGMGRIAMQIHQLESFLEEYRGDHVPFTDPVALEVLSRVQDAQGIFNTYLEDLKSLISEEDRFQREEIYRVRDSKITQLKEFIFQRLPESNMEPVEAAIDELRKQPIGPMLLKLGAQARELADQMDKPVRLDIKGGETEVNFYRLVRLFGILGHLVRNCVDHGLEDSEVRAQRGKEETGTIVIEAESRDNGLKLTISDDGGGIDLEKVKAAALENGVVNSSALKKLSDAEVAELIFRPGFSTKETVSEVSGRGVGLDAVKSEVERIEGSIAIHTTPQAGTAFEITIPRVV